MAKASNYITIRPTECSIDPVGGWNQFAGSKDGGRACTEQDPGARTGRLLVSMRCLDSSLVISAVLLFSSIAFGAGPTFPPYARRASWCGRN
jgi:hypothetical protein